jgi:hypothetical protein
MLERYEHPVATFTAVAALLSGRLTSTTRHDLTAAAQQEGGTAANIPTGTL